MGLSGNLQNAMQDSLVNVLENWRDHLQQCCFYSWNEFIDIRHRAWNCEFLFFCEYVYFSDFIQPLTFGGRSQLDMIFNKQPALLNRIIELYISRHCFTCRSRSRSLIVWRFVKVFGAGYVAHNILLIAVVESAVLFAWLFSFCLGFRVVATTLLSSFNRIQRRAGK